MFNVGKALNDLIGNTLIAFNGNILAVGSVTTLFYEIAMLFWKGTLGV